MKGGENMAGKFIEIGSDMGQKSRRRGVEDLNKEKTPMIIVPSDMSNAGRGGEFPNSGTITFGR